MIAAFDLPAIGRSAGALRFRQAGKPQRPLHPACRRSGAGDPIRGVLDYVPNGAELKAKLNDTTRSQLLRAMPSLKERAKTLIELIDGAYFIFADRPLQVEPKAQALLTAETRRPDRPAARGTGGGFTLERGDHRGRHAHFCRGRKPQARRGGAAAPCRFDRAYHVTGHFRRSGGPWPEECPGAGLPTRPPRKDAVPLRKVANPQ